MKCTAPTFHRIRKLSVVGGFLDGLEVDFADGLICVIGPRGTGKSTVVEMMRYALDAMPGKPGDALRKRAESLIEYNLGDGQIELAVETKNGLSYTITRAFGDVPEVLDENGHSVSMRVRGALLFQADFFSQNEMESIAETPHYQLALIDKFEQTALAEIQWKLEEVLQKLETNKGLLIPAQTKRDQLELHVKELRPLEEKLKAYASPGTEDAKKIDHAEHNKGLRDRESKALDATLQAIKVRHGEAKALKGAFSTDVSEKTTISPARMAAQSSRERLASFSRAVSTMAKRGRKLWRSSRRWHLAAALRRRCLAQSMQEATRAMVVESTTWMTRRKRRATPLPRLPRAKAGWRLCRCSSTTQKTFSARLASRSLLAWERLLRLGGVAARSVTKSPPCKRKASHTSLRPMAWVRCA